MAVLLGISLVSCEEDYPKSHIAPYDTELLANLHKNLGFLCQSNKKQDHLPLFRLIRTLGTQFFVIFRSPVINL